MLEFIISPFLLGLSVGIYCFSYCIPFAASFIVSEQRQKKENLYIVLKFIFGRFLGYLVFGAVFGYLGQSFNVFQINLILNIALILLSLLLIIHALGFIDWKYFSFCRKFKKYNNRLPVLMGFLMGVNVCPPFLMSVVYVFNLHSVFLGVMYFLMFFLATSVYFLPLFFLGFLNKLKSFQLVGRVSALIVGTIFFIYGLYYIIKIL
ncbi:hypothetical protein AMJ47_00645 [Parcubacteria bacterium DG_72]|nr:MAG: hypothetical protein AMJ47_00645 [Parcubacteria bacterium DG_72]